MYCSHCGVKLEHHSAFCSKCGVAQAISPQSKSGVPLYHLSATTKRKYDITVYQDKIVFSGKFYHLRNKEVYRNKEQTDTAFLHNYLGIGYLSQRSHRKTIFFLIGGTILELAKFTLDKLTDLADTVNDYLKWVDRSISLPEWMNNTVNAFAILCILLGVVLFFSKKKVIEISFTDKRICVPQNSMSKSEYHMLYQTIKSARNLNT